MRRTRERRRTAQAWVGSLLVHGTVLVVAWLTAVVKPRPIQYEVIQVQMVEAPEDEFVLETPDPVPEPPPEELEPEPDPEPPPVQEEAPEPEPEPEEEEPEPEEPEPEPQPERTEETADVTMEGLQRDHPEYYQDIVFQMTRCFQVRWTKGGDWRATIDFVINADGSVAGRDIDIHRSSGNLSFDLAAVEAVECAGTKLEALPGELAVERLPVRFNFEPLGSGSPGAAASPAPGTPAADPSEGTHSSPGTS